MTDKNNRGAIWPSRDKKSDKHPDFKGQATIDGVEYWISAWKRGPDANPKAPSLTFAVQPKDEAHKQGMQQAQQAVEETDDIPF